ncbi:hypothetical protein KJ966_23115 [bacterium]|nr:hypothetical protein [bacterium]
MGDMLRLAVEAGMPNETTVSKREGQNDFLGCNIDESQRVKSQWYGLGFDWGLWEKDGFGIAITLMFRQVQPAEDDLFDTRKDLDASGLCWRMGLRYRL